VQEIRNKKLPDAFRRVSCLPAFLPSLTSSPERQAAGTRVPGNDDEVSRKGAKEGKSRSNRDERHQAIERNRGQKNLGKKMKNEK
jgi:hypothetical protein